MKSMATESHQRFGTGRGWRGPGVLSCQGVTCYVGSGTWGDVRVFEVTFHLRPEGVAQGVEGLEGAKVRVCCKQDGKGSHELCCTFGKKSLL
jgi:hypothetical protein